MPASRSPGRSALAVTCLLFMVVFLATAPNARANTIYNLVDYPSDEAGWKLSGSITTDGTIGDILPNDIVGWTWTASNGVASFTTNSTDNGSRTYTSWIGFSPNYTYPGILATPTKLSILDPGTLYLQNSWTGTSLDWTRWTPQSPAVYTANAPFSYNINNGFMWEDGYYENTNPPTELPAAGWVIATAAPEPSTLTLLGSALLGLGVVYLRRRKATA